MDGFFPETMLLDSRPPVFLTPRCGQCKLCDQKEIKSPKMPVAGRGRKGILVIGEAPGQTEDDRNLPFQGKAGQRLQRTMMGCGADLFEDCWVTNALICRPPGNKIPKETMIGMCRPNVINAIDKYKPTTIILLGAHAIKSVIGAIWREDPGGPGRWAGFRIPVQRWNCWVCPMYHPSHIDHMGDNPDPVAVMEFREHLDAAIKTAKSRPYQTVPDYRKQVRVIMEPAEAVPILMRMNQETRPIAFDFETDRLKPDHPNSRIVCCAVSNGSMTISYPWHGKAISTTKSLLDNGAVPKIGANIKFEARWTKKKLGIWVRNWIFDVVLGAHCIDTRPAITSVKFQAFARFGIEDYDYVIQDYLEATPRGGNNPNRIKDVDLNTLLMYCGLDALMEYKIALQQSKELGVMLCPQARQLS